MIRKKTTDKNTRKLDELSTAIAINDINTIHELLLNNIDLNAPDSRGVYTDVRQSLYHSSQILPLLDGVCVSPSCQYQQAL